MKSNRHGIRAYGATEFKYMPLGKGTGLRHKATPSQAEQGMDERFKLAVIKLLALEGGYVNDPDDHGGETKFGISKRSYPDVDIKNLTVEEAEKIYFRDWWEKYGYDRILNQKIVEKVFSFAVNMGAKQAHVLLQEAVVYSEGKYIYVDGILGPRTIEAVNSHPNPDYLLMALELLAIQYYVSLNKPKFLAGWVKRAVS